MKKVRFTLCLLIVIMTSAVIAQKKGEMPFTSSAKETNKSLRDAWVALADFRVDEANEYVRKILNEDPECSMCYVSFFPFDDEQAVENLQKASSMNISSDEKMFIDGVIAHREKRSTESYFEPLIKKYPSDSYLHLWIMLNNSNPVRAIELGENLIKRHAKLAPAYNLLGYLYMNQNDMARAETYFDKYLALEPDLANPYDSKGDFLMKAGKVEEAITLYEKASELGMATSKLKAEEAKAKLKYPILSKDGEAKIEAMLSASIDAYDQRDADALLKDYSQHAVKIWGDQTANVGIANVRESFFWRFKSVPFTKFEGSVESIHGVGTIAIAYGKIESVEKNVSTGEETERKQDFIYLLRKRGDEDWKILADHFYGDEHGGVLSDRDKQSIQALLKEWDHVHALGGPITEEHLPAYAAVHSSQIMEIYPNQVTNVGRGNQLRRLSYAVGTTFEKSSLNPMGIEGFGRRAVTWGIASQIVLPKNSDKSVIRQYPWAMILTKERDDVWRVLVIHWAP